MDLVQSVDRMLSSLTSRLMAETDQLVISRPNISESHTHTHTHTHTAESHTHTHTHTHTHIQQSHTPTHKERKNI